MKPQRLRAAIAATLLAAVAGSSIGCSASMPAAMAPMDAAPSPAPAGLMPAAAAPAAPGTLERADEPRTSEAPGPGEPAKEAPAPRPAVAQNGGPAPTAAKSGTGGEEAADAPLIVYQGELTLRVEAGTGPGAVDTVVALAESLGGHLAGRDEGRVVVKIPSRRFREAMTSIDSAFDVERRNVKAEDVTAEFKDLEVRLDNLRATRKRIEELMQKSGTLADTLSVERELERVAAEIDRIQGRLRFLRSHTSFSTLTANVVEKPKAAQVVAIHAPAAAKRDLALPLAWLDRVGIDTLVAVPPED